MNGSGHKIRRVVPRATLYGWVAGLIAVPLAWLWLDPLTDAARIGVHGVPCLEGLMQVARPFGKFETQALMALMAFVIARRLRWRQARSWLAITAVAVLTTAAASNLMKLAVLGVSSITSSKVTSGSPAPSVKTLFRAMTAWVGGNKSAKLKLCPPRVKRVPIGTGKAAPLRNMKNPNGKLAITKACETVFEKLATIIPTPMIEKLVMMPTSTAIHKAP